MLLDKVEQVTPLFPVLVNGEQVCWVDTLNRRVYRANGDRVAEGWEKQVLAKMKFKKGGKPPSISEALESIKNVDYSKLLEEEHDE
jgi:hypothetical protein